MRIGILGGSGFIGSHLVENLSKKNEVIVFSSRKHTNFEECLERDEKNTEDFDVLINCSGYRSFGKGRDIHLLAQVNFTNPAKFFSKLGCEKTVCINFSTYVQLKHYQHIGQMEDYVFWKKQLSQFLINEFNAQSGLIYDLYLFTIFGDGDRVDRFVPSLLKAIQVKQTLHLSPGNQLMNFLHVDDLVNLVEEIIKSPPSTDLPRYNAYRCWDHSYIKLVDLVTQLQNCWNYSIDVVWGKKNYKGHEMLEMWDFNLERHSKLKISQDIFQYCQNVLKSNT